MGFWKAISRSAGNKKRRKWNASCRRKENKSPTSSGLFTLLTSHIRLGIRGVARRGLII